MDNTKEICKAEIEREKVIHYLNSQYTFENLLIGRHNKLAIEAIKEFVHQGEGGIFMLFSEGNQENGKTHIAQAAGHLFFDEFYSKCLYSTAENYASYIMNHIHTHVRGNEKTLFRKIYYKDNMNFILDDISFLLNKEMCIKYFKEWLRYCLKRNEKVILTLSNNPKETEMDTELKELILRYPCYKVGSPTPSFMEKYVRYLAKEKEVVLPEKEIECLAKKDFREIQSRIIGLARGKEIFES
ncbi:MAG: DnaA ATPase domain-containing protein [Lachnospiraceae bacterium]